MSDKPAMMPDASDLAAAALRFTAAWNELLPMLPDDYACHLNCAEAEAAADLYRAAGDDATAASIVRAHAWYDEEGDAHYEEPETAEVVDP